MQSNCSSFTSISFSVDSSNIPDLSYIHMDSIGLVAVTFIFMDFFV